MQQFDINSEFTCLICPKRMRKHSSVDITIRNINKQFPNYIESFANDSMAPYGANLGRDEPHSYSHNYDIDEHCRITDVETKTTRIE
ncbi:unnamed protein product [Rotaria sp. Silwood2]|nr:unnamed protein product [Rotaria sp. Silwood2]CAF4097744.1 unnamed protein product [Rotaria sp. Silwood2]